MANSIPTLRSYDKARSKLYFSFNDVLSEWIVPCDLETILWKDLIEPTNTLRDIPKSIDEMIIKKELEPNRQRAVSWRNRCRAISLHIVCNRPINY